MLVRDDLRTHLALTFSRQLTELPVVVPPPRPRKTFSLNDPDRICDIDAAPLHNQLCPTGRIPVLFDSLFPFVVCVLPNYYWFCGNKSIDGNRFNKIQKVTSIVFVFSYVLNKISKRDMLFVWVKTRILIPKS